jgi:hypothetical protein
MTTDSYEVYVVRHAHQDGRANENFLGSDLHDCPMPLDYFAWVSATRIEDDPLE